VISVGGLRSALLILCFAAALSGATAQPDVEIYWDPNDRADTVMDFGVTLEGAPVTLTFTVVNRESVDVGILLPNSQADPYYQIVNTAEYPPEHPRKEEFVAREALSYLIPAGETRSFGVIYRALANNPIYPPDSSAEALLLLRVVRMTDSLGASADKTFLLRALKTKNILASTTPWLRFDSVYVQPRPAAPEREYQVKNVTSFRIPVRRQLLEPQTSVVGQPEFEVDTFNMAEFGPLGTLTWKPRYRPHDLGRDSAHFLVVYQPNENAIPDTVFTRLSGIGVAQILNVVNANGQPQPVVVRGDTIDFGFVDVGDEGGVTATIILRNEGNVNILVTDELENGIPRDTQAYVVERPLRTGGAAIRTNAIDTLTVRFDPVDGGTHRMRYEIQTDLLSRPITGIPDGAQTVRLHFVAFARKPQMQVSPASIEFGTVVLLDDCPSASVRRLTVRNIGNSLLRVDSIAIDPPQAPILIDDESFTVEVAESHDVVLRYEPQLTGTLNATVTLFTNAVGMPFGVAARGRSIAPDSITVRLPSEIRARPGTPIAVPVMVDADRVTLAETSHLTVSFDPALLRYRASRTEGTASEGSTIVRQQETSRGVLEIDLAGNGAFLERDTFLVITFDTYLGDRSRTEIAISNATTTFGNAGCVSVLDVTALGGSFAIDSVCGLSVKSSAVSGFLIEASVFPNPAVDDVRVTIATAEAQDVEIRCLDGFGRSLVEPVVMRLEPGVNLIPLEGSPLPPGAWFIDVRGQVNRVVVPLMVQR